MIPPEKVKRKVGRLTSLTHLTKVNHFLGCPLTLTFPFPLPFSNATLSLSLFALMPTILFLSNASGSLSLSFPLFAVICFNLYMLAAKQG